MRLSTRGRFAITAMIDLALRDHAKPVPLVDLALRHHISLSYLEQVFAKLRQRGLVDSTRGPGGGYTLAHSAETISVADIICAIDDGKVQHSASSAHEGQPDTPDMTQDLWEALHTTIVAYLQTISLHSLAQEQRAKGFEVKERRPAKSGVLLKPASQIPGPSVPNSVFALAHSLP